MFEGVDLDVPAGGMLVAHGPAGSGRTALLLVLAGRMRPGSGVVRLDGGPAVGRRRARQAVAVARAEPAVGLEGRLRVRELVAERRWIERAATPRRIVEAARLVGLRGLRGDALAEDLAPLEALQLAVALAFAAGPAALVVDGVDDGLPDADRHRAWQGLEAVRASGCTVLASALQPPPAAGPDTVLLALPARSADRLPAARPAAEEAA
ncbi:ABC transporter ATP-binding protein [Kitasatospora sp. MMS16-BH015]|uniref:ATP-binding cassette domain-containing protein n=1 Tax=Kitasatospora sp. MMS16-BH015 TaxID=2018025 RepID=UPI000CA3462A|nr:ATP-binding cassette domain-containing protein [Kitasatospora sp. MMS16-BH015]AUG75906.1 ABC transporter ATP-binding protein [Kitasatospora sp. MMS16-BH015]